MAKSWVKKGNLKGPKGDLGDWKRGELPEGYDIFNLFGADKVGLWSCNLASTAATILNLPQDLYDNPASFVVTVKTLNNGVVLQLNTYSVYGDAEYICNSAPSTGTGWTAWKKYLLAGDVVDPDYTLAPSAAGYKAAALALTSPSNASATIPATGTKLRLPVQYGVPLGRVRLHGANRNDRGDTTYPGAVSFTGIWFGPGNTATGVHAIAPTQVAPAFTAPADGSEWVSPWFDANTDAGAGYLLSTGFTAPSGTVAVESIGTAWVGAGSPSGTAAPGVLTKSIPFDFWLEVEVPATVPVVAELGSSGAAGVGSDRPMLDSALSIYARRVGALPLHYAHSGSTLSIWDEADHQKWQKWQDYARPDALLLSLGSNDVYGSATLDETKAKTAEVLAIVEKLATENVYATTIPPRDSSTDETTRRAYNAWLLTKPLGIRDVFDWNGALSADDETTRPEFYADGTHTNTAGAQAKADAITRPVVPAPPTEGEQGVPGPPGAGVPTGGLALQVIRKDAANTTTEWVTPSRAMVGLSNVDNTPDTDKPVSAPQAAALVAKADLFAYVKPGQDLQAAITAATGKVLLLTAGTYTATSINIAANVELWCEPGTVIKQAAGANRHFIQITAAGVQFRMRGGTIDQNNAGQTTGSGKFAFNMQQPNAGAEFHNVTFKDSCEGAIRVVGDRDPATRETLKVLGCKFRGGTESESAVYDTFTIFAADAAELVVQDSDFDHGLTLTKQGIPAITVGATVADSAAYTRTTVRNNTFRGYGRFTVGSGVGVIDFYAWGESLDIEGNKFYDTMGAPIRGKVNVRNALIRGNQLLSFSNSAVDAGGGINIVRATLLPAIGNIEIASNIIVGAKERGIEVSNDPTAIGAVRIHNNQVSGSGGTSIFVMGLTDFNVHDNTVTGGASTGIVYSQCSGSGSISKNIVTGMAQQGIINNGAQPNLDLQVHDNLVASATTSGITVEDVRYLSLQGNTVKDTVSGGAAGQRGYRIGGTAGIPTAHIKNNSALGTFTQGAFSVTGAGMPTRYEQGNSWNGQVLYASAAPTTGTYARGDVVWNTLPVAGGAVGWSCVTAGTPGTWKAFGTLAA